MAGFIRNIGHLFFRLIRIIVLLFILVYVFNIISIARYSKKYSNGPADVAIVLGAGVTDGQVDPVFKERINHAVKLYKEDCVDYIIFTGGFGAGEPVSDSRAAMEYAVSRGIPEADIYIEEKSGITWENLVYAQEIMDNEGFDSALLVSDPIHMRRAMHLANKLKINCMASPTKTSMYRSRKKKIGFLLYESFFLIVDSIMGHVI